MDTGEQQQQQTTTTTKKPTVSPIVVTDHETDIQAMVKKLNLECNLKINSVGRKIFPNTAEEKEKIMKCLKDENNFLYTSR